MNKFYKSLNYSISIITGIVYFVCLVILLTRGEARALIFSIANPLLGVILCSVVRRIINAPRPYEVYGTKNLIDKKTAGKSFPSRHVFSIFVIASTLCANFLIPGAVLMALGIILCFLRVKAGVHFVRDVVAGALSGILVGAVTFFF